MNDKARAKPDAPAATPAAAPVAEPVAKPAVKPTVAPAAESVVTPATKPVVEPPVAAPTVAPPVAPAVASTPAPIVVPIVSGISPVLEVGKQLYTAREAAHLSQAEVANRMRLSERQIIALETGDLAALPGATFVRGFIRNYALIVGLDPKTLLATLEQVPNLAPPALELHRPTHTAMSVQSPMVAVRKKNRLVVAAGLVLFAIAVAFTYYAPEQFNFKLAAGKPSGNSPVGLPVEHEMLLRSLPPAEESSPDAPPPAEEASVLGVNALPNTPAAALTPAAAPASQGSNNLLLEFLDESWVEITNQNEEKVHSRLHEAFSSHELRIAPPVTIVIGRASSVRLYYKGNPIPLKPNSNDVAIVKL